MAHSRNYGQLFEIDGTALKIMGLQGMPDGKKWDIGISLSGGDDYALWMVEPAPAIDDVRAVIAQDVTANMDHEIRAIAVSNRVAVRLWLDGTLQVQRFHKAVEGTVTVSKEIPEVVPVLILPSVDIDGRTVPMIILPETAVGAGMIATLDSHMRIVGADPQDEPVLAFERDYLALPNDAEDSK